MYMDKFSDKCLKHDIKQYPNLDNAAKVLSRLGYDGYELIKLPNEAIGFVCGFVIDNGTDSLLPRVERVIIEINVDNPESCCPKVYPDRLDFPFEKLPHVNYPKGVMPPSLCLSREDPEEWYSEISFEQFVKTLIEWLSDAANDRLIKVRDKDEYEPFRVPETDAILFWYDEMDNFVENSIDYCCEFHDVSLLEDNNIGAVKFGFYNCDKKALLVHLSRPNNQIETDWFIKSPKTVIELYYIIEKLDFRIDFTKLKLLVCDNSTIDHVYLAFSVLRPTKIVGKLNRVDTICFKYRADAIRNDDGSLPVEPVVLFDQTTSLFASRLSNTNYELINKHILILGVGAVGSKLVDHLYRGGVCNLTICDKDNFMPHNVFRHALSNGYCFDKKVDLMKSHLKEMFMLPVYVNTVFQDAVDYLQKSDLSAFDIIIDATASSRVMYELDEIGYSGIIVRVCLSNFGNVGMTYICRNSDVKLQEYYMQIMRLSKSNDNFGEDISKWIRSEVSTTLDRVRIGEGCHSNTMIVADDVISAHTAVSSTIVKSLFRNESKKNELYLSFTGCDYPGSFFTVNYSLPKYVSLNVDNKDWSVRIPEDLLEDIRTKTKVSGKNENGGYLVGFISEKRKTVYILDHFLPRDSGRGPTQLRLGTSGVKVFFDEWNKRSGGQVIYLGDWHSHPNGSVERSEQDKQTFSNLKFELKSFGVCIITNGHNEKAYII